MRRLISILILVAVLCGCEREVYVCHKVTTTKQNRNKGDANDIKVFGEVLTWTKEEWQCQKLKGEDGEFLLPPELIN